MILPPNLRPQQHRCATKPAPLSPAMDSKTRSLMPPSSRRHRSLALAVLFALLTPIIHAQKTATTQFSGQAAYTLTKQLLDVAPKRFNGSPGHAKAEEFLKQHFAPEAAKGNFVADTFTATTPAGLQTMTNYIVKYPGKKDGIIVLVSHYETNYPLRDINFYGANDGAATSALLIEIGTILRAHPPEGYCIWLVFDDGEEAVKTWSNSDSLYGTRHLAAKWSQDGTLTKIKALLVADMIADKDLNIDYVENSTPWLLDLLKVAAKNTGHSASIFKYREAEEDDHLPFAARGVPVLDLIDAHYGPTTDAMPDGYHHTDKDTLDKISAHSLQISGDIFLEMIRLINQRP
ncbi:M28 family peptidase [Tunturiibacter gelidoferens]|uniref:Zn-dependent M28 family amino/carboxypeptidase n=1 Tax=Tunturiibacter gelidiferens TaxID=3069689 RepID=A0A9X0U5A6_9BACT|nr:M28 family peptidase [Edaphobacter lichenicola]MBB5328582.1 Zn-dependent M28 family amino/carboxypeptidase [Edaphobacter lichenicola]